MKPTIEEHEVERVYWDISQVAEMFNVRPSLIRFWLDEFGIGIKRDRIGRRKFTKDDIEKVKRLYDLIKVQKYTLAGAKQQF